jgi:hypothetical protein
VTFSSHELELVLQAYELTGYLACSGRSERVLPAPKRVTRIEWNRAS